MADGDMHGALDLAAGAGMALAGAGGAGFGQNGANLTGATTAIGAAAETIIGLPSRLRSGTIGSDGPFDLTAGQDVAGADDHA
jgi:hypothetical protein